LLRANAGIAMTTAIAATIVAITARTKSMRLTALLDTMFCPITSSFSLLVT